MRIIITKALLLDALNKVQKVVPSKGSMRIIENALFSADDGKLVITGTNLDITIVANAECGVLESGQTTLPVKMMTSAISKCADGMIEISSDLSDKAVVTAGTTTFRIVGLPAKDFPILSTAEGVTVEVKCEVLKEMFRKVKYAASQDDTRHSLKSVFIEIKDKTISAVATDGRRLAKYEVSTEIDSDAEVLLPITAVEQVLPNIKGEGACKITLDKDKMTFNLGSVIVYTKLVDDKYPNYRQIIPTEFAHLLTVDRENFIQAIERVSVFASDGTTGSIEITIGENQMVLKASTTDVGESRDVLPVKFDGTEPITIRLNPTYVKDALNALDEDDVQIQINSGVQPINIKRPDTSAFTYICMPLRAG